HSTLSTNLVFILTVHYCFCCFFFQAEDGIRDFHVTGVQTCALPIYPARLLGALAGGVRQRRGIFGGGRSRRVPALPRRARPNTRSEERRVGKECRYMGSEND